MQKFGWFLKDCLLSLKLIAVQTTIIKNIYKTNANLVITIFTIYSGTENL